MNLPPFSIDELIKNVSLMKTPSYRADFLKLASLYKEGKKMTALQKDQLVAHAWAIAYGLDPSCL